jgi:hypothetical protein
MEKKFLLGAIALMISLGISAQNTATGVKVTAMDQVRKKDRLRIHDPAQVQSGTMNQEQTGTLLQKHDRKRDRIHTPAVNHGQYVSETAKTTESGPGKGEIVSQQAKIQDEAQQAKTIERKAMRTRPAARGTGKQNTPAQRDNMRTVGKAKAGRQ